MINRGKLEHILAYAQQQKQFGSPTCRIPPGDMVEIMERLLAQPVSGSYTLNSPVIPDGWIACSEQMPTPFVDVIASDGKQTICAHVIEDRWWCIVSETAEEPGPIIFWMSLPAAPEGGNG